MPYFYARVKPGFELRLLCRGLIARHRNDVGNLVVVLFCSCYLPRGPAPPKTGFRDPAETKKILSDKF